MSTAKTRPGQDWMLMQLKSNLAFVAIQGQTEQLIHAGSDSWARDLGIKRRDLKTTQLSWVRPFKIVVLGMILELED